MALGGIPAVFVIGILEAVSGKRLGGTFFAGAIAFTFGILLFGIFVYGIYSLI
jgi:hypothetical protein